MAIDYKVEWEKLREKHGLGRVMVNGKSVHICQVMDNQIQRTINNREKLMEEYVKENMMTEIDGADKSYHHVKISNTRKARGPIGTMYIHRKDFDAWCKKKGGKT